MFRHGDLLLVRVGRLPEGCQSRETKRAAVLAEGEVTGHAHTLTGAALQLWELGNRLFAELPQGGSLTHQEHATVAIPPGIWEVLRQRVYHPEEIRRVID